MGENDRARLWSRVGHKLDAIIGAFPQRRMGSMKRFTDSGRRAVKDDNLYAALSLALTIPDICGSLEDPGPGKSQKRYERWCEKWLVPKFTRQPLHSLKPLVFITADQMFQIRCSLIHSGRDEIATSKRTGIDQFHFFDQTSGSHLNKMENCRVNGVAVNFIQLKTANFCDAVYDAADEWDVSVANDPQIQKEKSQLLRIHSKGTTIHGWHFG